MVKFSHSIFALPYALSGALLAANRHGFAYIDLVWIVLAMVGARNAAMGFNRLADHAIDSLNPRTVSRELPSGRLKRRPVWIMTIILSLLFVFSAFMLNLLCGLLSPIALAVTFGYSYTKRFTWICHLALGLSLAMAPLGGWLAIAGNLAATPLLMAAAVAVWVAGFDIIYSCQDMEFDSNTGLHSIPARFGIKNALVTSRLLHFLAVLMFACAGWTYGLNYLYWVGLLVVTAVLLWEHRLVRADRLDRIGMAFFNMNGIISVVYFVSVLASVVSSRTGW